jgi:hypothetical protein
MKRMPAERTEPELDLIQPGSVGGRKVQQQPGILGIELHRLVAPMS